MEAQDSRQVYSASRIRLGSVVPSCVLVFLATKCSLCVFSPFCQETAFSVATLYIQVSLFHLPFISAFRPPLDLETVMNQTFRNGQLWRPWLGSTLYLGSEFGGIRPVPGDEATTQGANSAVKCIKDQEQSSVQLCPVPVEEVAHLQFFI